MFALAVINMFSVSDGRIGYLSSALFAGMMIGAIGWGSCEINAPHKNQLSQFIVQVLIS